jgi:hypothetical protein
VNCAKSLRQVDEGASMTAGRSRTPAVNEAGGSHTLRIPAIISGCRYGARGAIE